MSKRTTPTKLGLGLLVALTLSTVSMSAHAGCKWYDAKCLAKEVKEKAEAAANAARALAEQQAAAARAEAERQAAAARAEAERQAAAAKAAADKAAKLAAEAKAAAEKAAAVAAAEAKKVAEAAAAEYKKQGLPLNADDAKSMAAKGLDKVAKSTQGAAFESMKATVNAYDTSVAELKKVADSMAIELPDVATILKAAGGEKIKQASAFPAKIGPSLSKLSAGDLETLNRAMRSIVTTGKLTADETANFGHLLTAIFGDLATYCVACPGAANGGKNGVAMQVVVTQALPTTPPVKLVFANGIRMSAYPVNGKPVFIWDWTTAVLPNIGDFSPIPEIGIEAKFIPGTVSEVAVQTGFGFGASSGSATGGQMTLDIGYSIPNSIAGFLDPTTLKKMLLEAPTKPETFKEKVAQMRTDLTKMITGWPAIAVGYTPGAPGTPPSGAPYFAVFGTGKTWQ